MGLSALRPAPAHAGEQIPAQKPAGNRLFAGVRNLFRGVFRDGNAATALKEAPGKRLSTSVPARTRTSGNFPDQTPPERPDRDGRTKIIPSCAEQDAAVLDLEIRLLQPATSTVEAIPAGTSADLVGHHRTVQGGQAVVLLTPNCVAKVFTVIPLKPDSALSADTTTWNLDTKVLGAQAENLMRARNEISAMKRINAAPAGHNLPRLRCTQLFCQKTEDADGKQQLVFMPGFVMSKIPNLIDMKGLAPLLTERVPLQFFIDHLTLDLIHYWRLSQEKVPHGRNPDAPFCHRDTSHTNLVLGRTEAGKISTYTLDLGLTRADHEVTVTGQGQGTERFMSRTAITDFKSMNACHDVISRFLVFIDTYISGAFRNDPASAARFHQYGRLVDVPGLHLLLAELNFPPAICRLVAEIPNVDHPSALMDEEQRHFVENVCRTVFGLSSFSTDTDFDDFSHDFQQQGLPFSPPEEGEKMEDWVQALLQHYRTSPDLNKRKFGLIQPWQPGKKVRNGILVGVGGTLALVTALFASGLFKKSSPDDDPKAKKPNPGLVGNPSVETKSDEIVRLFAEDAKIPTHMQVLQTETNSFGGIKLMPGTSHELSLNFANTAWNVDENSKFINFACTRLSAKQLANFFGLPVDVFIERVRNKSVGADEKSAVYFTKQAEEFKQNGIKDTSIFVSKEGHFAMFVTGGSFWVVAEDDGFNVFGFNLDGAKNSYVHSTSPTRNSLAYLNPCVSNLLANIMPDDKKTYVLNPKMSFIDPNTTSVQTPGAQLDWMLKNNVGPLKYFSTIFLASQTNGVQRPLVSPATTITNSTTLSTNLPSANPLSSSTNSATNAVQRLEFMSLSRDTETANESLADVPPSPALEAFKEISSPELFPRREVDFTSEPDLDDWKAVRGSPMAIGEVERKDYLKSLKPLRLGKEEGETASATGPGLSLERSVPAPKPIASPLAPTNSAPKDAEAKEAPAKMKTGSIMGRIKSLFASKTPAAPTRSDADTKAAFEAERQKFIAGVMAGPKNAPARRSEQA